MKNKPNKTIKIVQNSDIHCVFQRFIRKSEFKKSPLGLDVSECSSLFNEKLPIIFENIRV